MAECRRANLGDMHPCRGCAVSARAVCNTLDVPALAELRNQGGEVRLSAGEALFHQGDRADCVFSLTSGIIQLYALLPDGRRQVIAFHSARERLACFLHDVHHRSHAGTEAPGNVIHLPMSRIDIADYLGLTKETVSREFTALRQARTIRSRPGRQLEILDMARIRSLAFGTGTFSEPVLAAL